VWGNGIHKWGTRGRGGMSESGVRKANPKKGEEDGSEKTDRRKEVITRAVDKKDHNCERPQKEINTS